MSSPETEEKSLRAEAEYERSQKAHDVSIQQEYEKTLGASTPLYRTDAGGAPIRALGKRSGAKTKGATGDPKGEAGSQKPTLGNISLVAQYYEGAVMAGGADEYGAYNWCEHPMKASTYYEAILRHLSAWWGGEDLDPKSGLPHQAHIRANTGILMDQQAANRMIDDRPKMLAPLAPIFQELANKIAVREKNKREDKLLNELFDEVEDMVPEENEDFPWGWA